MTLTITASAETVVLPPLPDLNQSGAVLQLLGALPDILATAPLNVTGGTYSIAATYCPPRGGDLPHENDVQLLVHGATYTKEYWMAGAWRASRLYSWTQSANQAGFGTLAVDRLGNGQSDRPDPAQEVQGPLEVEILNAIAQKIKTGEITGTPSNVIFVGHSTGAIIGTLLATKYPDSIDKLVLTGYTTDSSAIITNIIASDFRPAKDVEPARFADLPQGYITQSVQAGRTLLAYAGKFDPAFPARDFATKDTIAAGSTLLFATAPAPIPGYKGPVFVLTGDKDQPFCPDPNASCEPVIQATASQFPHASNFAYFIPKKTGHSLNFHFSAPISYAKVNRWLLVDSNSASY